MRTGRHCSPPMASWTLPSGATACCVLLPSGGRMSHLPASRSRRASPPRPRQSRRWSHGLRGCPKAWWCCPGLWLANVFPGRGMGCARPGRGWARGGQPPAVPAEALARPAWRRASRGAAVARVGGGASSPARGRAVANAMAAPRILAQMGDAEGRRTAAVRHPAGRAVRSSRRSPGDRSGAARGAGDAGQDGGAGHSRSAARGTCFSAARALGYCGRRQRRQAAFGDARRDLAARHRGRRRRGTGAGAAARSCSSTRWSAAKATSGWFGSRLFACSTSSFADRVRPPALAGSMTISRASRANGGLSATAFGTDRRALARALPLATSPTPCRAPRRRLPATRPGAGRPGAWPPNCWRELQASEAAGALMVGAEEAVPVLRQLLEGGRAPALWWPPAHLHLGLARSAAAARRPGRARRSQRRRLAGLARARPVAAAEGPRRAQHADARQPHRACRARFRERAGCARSADHARAARHKSPTVASRFLLRLDAISGGLPRDVRLERLARALDDPGPPQPVDRPAPSPPAEQRPGADLGHRSRPAQGRSVRFLCAGDPEASRDRPGRRRSYGAVEGRARCTRCFEEWLQHDDCDPDKLRPRAERLLAEEAIHPMLRALWAPRLLEAIDWIAAMERDNRAEGRHPLAAEVNGEAAVAGVTVHGRADRIDRLPTAGWRSSTTRPASRRHRRRSTRVLRCSSGCSG